MSPKPVAGAVAALVLCAGPASAHIPEATASQVPLVLSPERKHELIESLIDQKPNPGYYAIASAVLPGAGQLALGEVIEPALVWGVLLSLSMAVYLNCEGGVGLHPAFLGTTPYVALNGVSIPKSTRCGEVNIIFNRALQLAYLGAAGISSWRTYDLAVRRRAEIDRRIEALEP